MPTRPTMPGMNDVVLEHLRMGTRDQFDSGWVQIADTVGSAVGSASFTHGLEEVPWVVDVLRSPTNDGKAAMDSNSDVTIVKTDTTITVTSNVGDGVAYYFKVRAM